MINTRIDHDSWGDINRDAWTDVKGTSKEDAWSKYFEKLLEVGNSALLASHPISVISIPDPQERRRRRLEEVYRRNRGCLRNRFEETCPEQLPSKEFITLDF